MPWDHAYPSAVDHEVDASEPGTAAYLSSALGNLVGVAAALRPDVERAVASLILAMALRTPDTNRGEAVVPSAAASPPGGRSAPVPAKR